MKKYLTYLMLLAISPLLVFVFGICAYGQPNSTPSPPFIVKKKLFGDDSNESHKIKIAVIGDGYTENQQNVFDRHVRNLLGNNDETDSERGLFGNDIFREYKDVFSVYSLFVASEDSGITTTHETKNTALGIIYTGEWKKCYVEEYIPLSEYTGNPQLPPTQPPTPFSDSRNTDKRLKKILEASYTPHDYVLIIANYADDESGCRRGNRVYVTNAVSWQLLSHEFGHAIGNLYDEYWRENNPSLYLGQEIITERNCSTNKNNVPWRQILTNGISIPTDLQEVDNASNIIGVFRGCNYYSDNIFRPAINCRMRTPSRKFCPVCRKLLEEELSSHRPSLDSNIVTPNSTENLSIHINARINEGGTTEIISATGFSSNIKTITTATSKFIYEVRRDGKTEAVGILSEDPFVVRAISNRDKERGEIVGRSTSTNVSIDIPNTNIADLPTDKLSVRFYEIENGPIAPGTLITNITPATLETLKNRKQLEKFSEITNKELKSITIIKP